ncbi:hypothetical protein F5879DRAFT_910391, partial [Lentinula edodes]
FVSSNLGVIIIYILVEPYNNKALLVWVVAFSLLNLFYSLEKKDYPLNLSISISGGKETNKDSPSNCE